MTFNPNMSYSMVIYHKDGRKARSTSDIGLLVKADDAYIANSGSTTCREVLSRAIKTWAEYKHVIALRDHLGLTVDAEVSLRKEQLSAYPKEWLEAWAHNVNTNNVIGGYEVKGNSITVKINPEFIINGAQESAPSMAFYVLNRMECFEDSIYNPYEIVKTILTHRSLGGAYSRPSGDFLFYAFGMYLSAIGKEKFDSDYSANGMANYVNGVVVSKNIPDLYNFSKMFNVDISSLHSYNTAVRGVTVKDALDSYAASLKGSSKKSPTIAW